MTTEAETLLPPRLDGTHAIIPCRLTDGRAAELDFSAQLHHETPDPHVGWPGGWELESVELVAVRLGGLELGRDTWNRLIPRDADERASEFFDERIDEILPEGDGEPDGVGVEP
jgi:hypothetical protein